MTPTIVLKDGNRSWSPARPAAAVSHRGAAVISNVIDRRLPIQEAVAAPRIHDQWSPDEVVVEHGLRPTCFRSGWLATDGRPPRTSANSILITPQGFVGAADRAAARRGRRVLMTLRCLRPRRRTIQ
jgi:gamma-glutamyltranspeptidase/glutathione hydrolase